LKFLLDRVALLQGIRFHLGRLALQIGHEPLLEQIVVNPELEDGGFVIGLDGCGRRALAQAVRRKPGVEAVVVGLGSAQLLFGLAELLLQLRLAQFEDDRVGRDFDAGTNQDALDATLGGSRNQAPGLVDRHQCAQATDLPCHRPSFDDINPDGRALDGRRRGLEARQDDRDKGDDEHAGDRKRDATQFLLARD
jgi:hypothetical protein